MMIGHLGKHRHPGNKSHGFVEVRQLKGAGDGLVAQPPLRMIAEELVAGRGVEKGHIGDTTWWVVAPSRSDNRGAPAGTITNMALRDDQGIVLRGYPFGEADRVVVLLSPNRGKIRAVAKGIRKTKSRFGGRLEPFTQVEVLLYEGRNLDTVTQVAILEAFPRLRTSLERVTVAGAMVEAVDAVAQEDESSLRLFLALQRGLLALEAGPPHPDLLAAFYLKLAAAIGIAPALVRCASCGRSEDLHRFAFSAGGVLCARCVTGQTVKLRHGLVEHLAALSQVDLSELSGISEAADGNARSGEALGVTRRFVEYHIERRLSRNMLANA